MKPLIKQVVDVAYGNESGLSQAISLVAPSLPELRLGEELKILEPFFTSLQKSDELSLYGLTQITQAIGMGAVSRLIVCEDVITDSESKISSPPRNQGL